MLSTIVVATLLFCVALVILANACEPTLELHLHTISSAPFEDRIQTGSASENGAPATQLSDEERDGFSQLWQSVRGEFDADPEATVRNADLLVSDLIDDCGGGRMRREAQAALLNVTNMMSEYRNAHEIAVRSKEGWTKPQDLNRAMRLYTALVDELLGTRLDSSPFGDPGERL